MEGKKQMDMESDLVQQFLPWIDPFSNEYAPVVLVGAGLSAGLTPLANDLAIEVAKRKGEIEKKLGVDSACQIGNAQELYAWAEDCINQKVSSGTLADTAKKQLAEQIGLTADTRFLAQANVPLRGTTPRHRVLSRLAREGRVEALWSFNWDCWLEVSLESVGLRNGGRPARRKITPDGWKLRYHVWVGSGKSAGATDTVPVFKAHGCVRALCEDRGEFVIAKGEMELPLAKQPTERTARMTTEVLSRWAVALGWSGSESYVRELIREQGVAGTLGERITIVDVYPRQPEHEDVCKSYGCDIESAAVKVDKNSPGTMDDLFIWIQSLRGLMAIKEACNAVASLTAEVEKLQDSLPAFDSPLLSRHWCTSFLDSWLPVWLRTCFMLDAKSYGTKPGEEAEILPTDQRDAHIPWGVGITGRIDMQAASVLLAAISKELMQSELDFESYPGSIWDVRGQRALIPVPIWVDVDRISAISLKPLVESFHWTGKGKIKAIAILPLNFPASELGKGEASARLVRWREAVAALFGHPHLASPDNIEIVDLEHLASFIGEP